MRAIFRFENYFSVVRTFQVCKKPLGLLHRYLFSAGDYPATLGLRTPLGPIEINVYSPDDVQTVHEIFLKNDYFVVKPPEIVVDFGSNIGISTLYFLSRSPDCFVYGYEPMPANIDRYARNLTAFPGRYALRPVAVGARTETVRFGWEPTGRYGGVGRDTGHSICVPCVDSNEQLRTILAAHSQIDVLKIDIEGLESIVTERIPADIALRIRHIVVEHRFETNPLAATHTMKCTNNITRFQRIEAPVSRQR